MNQLDKNKIGKTALINPNYRELGIAYRFDDEEEEHVIALVFAQEEAVEDPDPEIPDVDYDLSEFKEAFDCFDVKGNGKVDLNIVLKRMEHDNISNYNVEFFRIMKDMRDYYGNIVTWPKFITFILGEIDHPMEDRGRHVIFNLFLNAGGKNIRLEKMKEIIAFLGPQESDAYAQIMKLYGKGKLDADIPFEDYDNYMNRIYS